MRLIDADALPRQKMLEAQGNGQYEDIEIVNGSDIENAPTIDAVEVVRCKDCFLYGECQAAKFYGDDGYCSCGKERR